ncbi:MAG TPA: cyclic nucleotide-binding domain-containing protein [Gaiellaceae bacterium]|nr:cyclic nucleotide-binding domain-containing protein [Gaiellaceae bacterium]
MDPKRLRDVPFFADLGKRELAQVGQWTDEVEVEAGTVLGRQGSVAYEFFVILDGAAEVVVDGAHVADLGPGDFFGEIGLLERARRTATVIASTRMRLIVVFGREFRAMERELPQVAARVREAIAERLERLPAA